MCYPDGGAVDDVILFKMDNERYLLVCNASNTDKVYAWMQENNGSEAMPQQYFRQHRPARFARTGSHQNPEGTDGQPIWMPSEITISSRTRKWRAFRMS
jgi:hypothetical protein